MNGKRKQTIMDAFAAIREQLAVSEAKCPRLDIEYVELDNTLLCETKAKEKKLIVNVALIGWILQRTGKGAEDIDAAKAVAGWIYGRELYFVLKGEDHVFDYTKINVADSIAAFKQGYEAGARLRRDKN